MGAPKPSDWCLHKRKREMWTQTHTKGKKLSDNRSRDGSDVATIKECLEPPEAGRGGKEPPLEASEGNNPVDT